MNTSLLIIIVFLGIFSILKIILFIIYGFLLKPKVNEKSKIVSQKLIEEDEDSSKKDDDFWKNW